MEIFRMFGEIALQGGKEVANQLQNVDNAAKKAASTMESTIQKEAREAGEEIKKIGDKAKEGAKEAGQATKTLEERLQDLADRAEQTGQEMSSALTLPIAAAGAGILKLGADFASGTARIQASLGATGEQAKELAGIANEVWKSGWGENLADVNDAVIRVQQNLVNLGNVGANEIKGITESAIVLRDLFGADIAESTRTAGTLIRNFGITGQEAMDLITKSFQMGGDFAGDLLDTLNEYAPQFAEMGFSADQFAATLIKGAQAGAYNLDKVADAVKEFSIRAQDGSETTAEGFKLIGLNADQMAQQIAKGGDSAQQAFAVTLAALASIDDPLKQETAGVALFGTQWEDVKQKVVLAMAEGQKGLEGWKGAADQAKKAMDADPYHRFSKIMRQVGEDLRPLANVLLDMAEKFLPPIAEAISTVAIWFSNLPSGIQTAIIGLLGFLAVIGPVNSMFAGLVRTIKNFMGIQKLIGSLKQLGTAFQSVIKVLNMLRVAFLSNPFLLLITIIAILVVLIITNWDTIKTYLINAWNYIKSVAISVWNAIKNFFVNLWNGIKTTATNIWNGIKSFFVNLWNGIKTTATNIWNGLKSAISSVWNSIKSVTSSVWNGIKSFVMSIWNGIKSGVTNAITGVKNTISNIWNSIKNTTSNLWNKIKSLVGDAITGAWNTIKSFGSRFLEAGKGLLNSLIDGITSGFKKAVDAVKSGLNKIRSFLPFSPAKEGPLSDLDKSGEAFFPTWASRMHKGLKPALATVSDGMEQTKNLLAPPRNTTRNVSFAGAGGISAGSTAGNITINNYFNIPRDLLNQRERDNLEWLAQRISVILKRNFERQRL